MGCFQHRDRSFRRDVDSRQVTAFLEEPAALAVGFLLDVVIFHRLQRLQVGIERFQRGLKRRIFLRVLGDIHVEDSDRNRAFFAVQKTSHEVGGDGAAGQRIDADHPEAAALRSIGGNANHRNIGASGASNRGSELLRTARENNDAVHLIPDRGFQRFFFTLSQSGAGAEFDFHIFQQDGFSLVPDPAAHLIPERRGALRRVDRDPQRFLRREITRGQVRTIAEVSRHLQNPGLGCCAYTRIVMQRPVDRSN